MLKNKLWLWQVPLIALMTLAFHISELGVNGQLENRFLRDSIFPKLRNLSSTFTDMKFRLRGSQAPKHKIVVVDIDNESIDSVGRWPWHRNHTAYLIQRTMELGAKAVALDIVFSEADRRVPEELQAELGNPELFSKLQSKLETDRLLTERIGFFNDRLVLGWTPLGICQPRYLGAKDCPVNEPELLKELPAGYEKFAATQQNITDFDVTKTNIPSAFSVIANLPEYNQAGKHAGFFYVEPDPDGIMRRVPMVVMLQGHAYPSLALELARTGSDDAVKVDLDPDYRVRQLSLARTGINIPVTPLGAAEVNFRGPDHTFKYVSAQELMIIDQSGRTLASESAKDLIKDAYVFIGLSALGVYDMRATPFSSNIAGVEVHANILDNILSHDLLNRGEGWADPRWIYAFMIVGGILFALFVERLEAIPALILAIVAFGGMGIFDVKILFGKNGVNWNTSLLAVELATIFAFTLAAKYVLEERKKKFVRGAFAKYVAPAVVDSILKDPTKLTVGGEKKDLTILFSDIRGFTTFSEKMDAKALSMFLNEYLGIMTEIVFANNGTLDKYIGDAIMAFWGAPLDQPNHAENACRAAVQMMQALEKNRDRFRQQYGVEVDIGIGLNTGNVSVGNMGSSNNFAYTVIGDHVNLASRLEGLTKYYGTSIVTTRFTFDSMQKQGGVEPPHRVLDVVKVKGKRNAVELIQVLDREISEEARRAFEGARLFYRHQKWDQAIELFKKANDLIMGESAKLGEMDGACSMYIERCEKLKAHPPGADWDGTWEMDTK
ncbi:MAG: CHASE2 domain-containing protein [Bdellovibrionia bacterium]